MGEVCRRDDRVPDFGSLQTISACKYEVRMNDGEVKRTENIYEGGCTCGVVRYRMQSRPMIVHCCHCHWCQRQTGTSYALNALIEADRVTLLQGEPEMIATPSPSGKGQNIFRCPSCHIAVWSNYSAASDKVHFIRVGTLDEAHQLPPDIHIYTSSKQPWVVIPVGHSSVEEYYDRKKYWPEESLERRKRILGIPG